jgi:hypothetical protein
VIHPRASVAIVRAAVGAHGNRIHFVDMVCVRIERPR